MIPIIFDEHQHACAEVQIEGNSYLLEIELNSAHPIYLKKDILLGIKNKQENEIISWRDVNGTEHIVPSYIIPKVQLDNLTLHNVLTCEAEDTGPYGGVLGEVLGEDLHVLLDFPHSRIIIDHSPFWLKKRPWLQKDWIQVPFTCEFDNVIFEVTTDFGKQRLLLNTTAPETTLRPVVSASGMELKSDRIYSTKFVLGDKDFGGLRFVPYDITPFLNPIDGFLGTDFLRQHTIYLDYTHEVAYIEPPREYLIEFPIALNAASLPCLAANVINQPHFLLLDLGRDALFSLDQKIADSVEKRFLRKICMRDSMGNEYATSEFSISKVSLGDLDFYNPAIQATPPAFYDNTSIISNGSTHAVGSIGQPILEQYNLCLDCPHYVIYAASNITQLKKLNRFRGKVLEIPFETYHGLIVCTIETDVGKKQFILDTGTTITTMNADLLPKNQIERDNETNVDYFTSGQFILGGVDFGARRMWSLKLHSGFEAILGMDFLRDHTLYIDYPNRIIYLEVPSSEEEVR